MLIVCLSYRQCESEAHDMFYMDSRSEGRCIFIDCGRILVDGVKTGCISRGENRDSRLYRDISRSW